MRHDSKLEAALRAKYLALEGVLNERARRLWAATESRTIGYGGDAVVASATGLARATIRAGREELKKGEVVIGRQRRPGGGRKALALVQGGWVEALERLVAPTTRGDPMSPLRWTCKSTRILAVELRNQGFIVSHTSVGKKLHELGYSLHALRKSHEGTDHVDRNAQFEHISAMVEDFQARNQPVISVDTKKKELVGNFRNAGREWEPKGQPEEVNVHDFPDDAVGKAIPYGVFDMTRNEAWVSVGRDHDTPAFAVASIRQWWRTMGLPAYPNATELLITADAGGSNGYRTRAWKKELQELADDTGLNIHVCHFPPGTSKWNKIEHRLFCHITQNWRGKPLTSFETVVNLIGRTQTKKGLRVRARLDKKKYPTGIEITKAEMKRLALRKDEFHGDWNYCLEPRRAK
ncbi:ISAzo13 family transposase [Cystobacter ferrugineus]|uniref:ISAzo13 family transposase n=2 Tax=Cystobacter ferrugineus TaxID=83449 RepID=A0A1L9AZY8_9BACT|nr:ISAzo13 family transposase [Cystobacter ferrugineus]OJH33477.1 ISAzo13 family transposase [Cystobacter ferrugineus]OJH33562.1 ISAzo13 family transposase [Cystobacter ferrugineus]OJH35572.1 ISAzo13 family transposase [Cystobacter ferrugineus]OJH40207.1 ISAzo13 family transposase [Cystobacter ferrugineus]OJH41194.1 ISAzo13 family transposase [Cystobacter ferrugineus]